MNKLLIKLALVVVLLRVIYFGISYSADTFLPYAPTFAYGPDKLAQYGVDRWIYSWGNFDGVHYLTIIEKGYLGTGLIQAFFPLYPMLSLAINQIIHNSLLSSLVASNLAAFTAIVLLYLLTKKRILVQLPGFLFLVYSCFQHHFSYLQHIANRYF